MTSLVLTPPARAALERCPVCGAALTTHGEEDAQHYEQWRYECGAEVIREEEHLFAEEACYAALRRALVEVELMHTDAKGSE